MKEKTLSVSAIKDGSVIDHITAGQALAIVRHLEFSSAQVTIGLNLKSASMGTKDLIKLEGVFLSPLQANQIAVFAPTATVNIIKNYKVAEKFRVELPPMIHGLLDCPNPRCITHTEPTTTSFKVEENNSHVLLRCSYCEKSFQLQLSKIHDD